MKTARVLFIAVLSAMALTAVSGAQELARLTVNDVGTPLDTPQIIFPFWCAVSPDGQWVAYLNNPSHSAIFVKPVNGGEVRFLYYYDQFAEQFKDDPVYNNPKSPTYPYSHGNPISSLTFTPDGREITFEVGIYDSTMGSTWQFRYDADGHYSGAHMTNAVPYIKSVNIETGVIRDITTGMSPVWDPTGQYLFMSNWDSLYFKLNLPQFLPTIMDTQTGEKRALDNEQWGPGVFTPDGQNLFISMESPQELTRPNGEKVSTMQIFKVSIMGGEPEQVSSMIDATYTGATNLVLSPDEKWLFFSKNTNLTRSVKAGSGNYSGPAYTFSVLDMITGNFYDLFPVTDNMRLISLAMSPDGKTLYLHVQDNYISLFKDATGNQNRSTWIVAYPFDPANLGKPFNFTNVVTPPVVVAEGWGKKLDILQPDTNPLATWNPTFNLTTQNFSQPVWSPDGKTVSFIPNMMWGI